MILGFWPNDFWTWAWIVWGFVYFGMVELPAVFNKRDDDTLSEHVWDWLGFGPHTGKHVGTRRILAILLWGTLTAHFFFRFV